MNATQFKDVTELKASVSKVVSDNIQNIFIQLSNLYNLGYGDLEPNLSSVLDDIKSNLSFIGYCYVKDNNKKIKRGKTK